MIIHVINRQKICKPNVGKIKAALNFFWNKAAPGSGWKEISLVLMDDDGIRKIKRQFFDVDCVTDVISFSPSPQPADGGRQPAEIVVNVERACLEGKKRRGLDDEFALYLAHGCDHLAGHNDRILKARNNMRRRERQWLNWAAKMNLLSGLFGPAHKRNP
ncbi:MAG: rRNA maturation RNase YbeY [Kiritimatiellia bacterium]|nr:rRNA maturation RNase YbeY [Kiritimatiellia bacterium]